MEIQCCQKSWLGPDVLIYVGVGTYSWGIYMQKLKGMNVEL